jgi:hypothetical protein
MGSAEVIIRGGPVVDFEQGLFYFGFYKLSKPYSDNLSYVIIFGAAFLIVANQDITDLRGHYRKCGFPSL